MRERCFLVIRLMLLEFNRMDEDGVCSYQLKAFKDNQNQGKNAWQFCVLSNELQSRMNMLWFENNCNCKKLEIAHVLEFCSFYLNCLRICSCNYVIASCLPWLAFDFIILLVEQFHISFPILTVINS